VNSTKFLRITIDHSISWKEQISELTSKLNKACYAIRAIKPLLSLHVLQKIYFAYFHSVMTYGIIFWGNSHLSSNIFKIQKRALRIMTNKSKRETCRPLYNQLPYHPNTYSHYSYLLLRIKTYSCLTQKFIPLIHVTTPTYTCLTQI